MAAFFFPDTTVLVTMAIVQRWDLLAALIGGKARWVSAVEDECRDWVSTFPDIHSSSRAIFGVAERPEGQDHQDIVVLRTLMAEPYDPPRRHLGEAETIVIVERRFSGSYFMTDDSGAARSAHGRDITCLGTEDILTAAAKKGLLSDAALQADLLALREAGRVTRSFS